MQQYSKKMNKAGSVTLPAAMRRELGIGHGERFKIAAASDGAIILQRVQGECIFCKSSENLITHAGRFVCRNCVRAMQGGESA